jgi:hypothetical protein
VGVDQLLDSADEVEPGQLVAAQHVAPIFGTVVQRYIEETEVEWVDWEDARGATSDSPHTSQ